MVEPIIAGAAPLADRQNTAAEPSKAGEVLAAPTPARVGGLHPFIQGLLETLPAPETNWTIEGRAKWLQAAARCFDLIYMGSGEIDITPKPGRDGDPRA